MSRWIKDQIKHDGGEPSIHSPKPKRKVISRKTPLQAVETPTTEPEQNNIVKRKRGRPQGRRIKIKPKEMAKVEAETRPQELIKVEPPINPNAIVDIPPQLLQQCQKIINWLEGKSSDPPKNMAAALGDINNKMTWAVTFNMIQGLVRAAYLHNELSRIDAHLHNQPLEDMSVEQIVAMKKMLLTDLSNNLNLSRKFISQNNRTMDRIEKENNEVADILRGFDRDTLKELKEALQGK